MKRILLVEDDKWLAQMYLDALEDNQGFVVDIAGSADRVFELLEEYDYELILLDLFLPVHSGVALLHELASYEDTLIVPVMILSSVSPSEAAIEGSRWQQYGVVDYLYKPQVKPQQLKSRVERFFVENHRDNKEGIS